MNSLSRICRCLPLCHVSQVWLLSFSFMDMGLVFVFNFPLKGEYLFVVQRNDSRSSFCVSVPTVNAIIIIVGKSSQSDI